MPKLTFQWKSVPKLTLGAEVHRLVPKLFRAEVTRAEHRLPQYDSYPKNRAKGLPLGRFHRTVFAYVRTVRLVRRCEQCEWANSEHVFSQFGGPCLCAFFQNGSTDYLIPSAIQDRLTTNELGPGILI